MERLASSHLDALPCGWDARLVMPQAIYAHAMRERMPMTASVLMCVGNEW